MIINISRPIGFSEVGERDNQEDCIYPSFENARAHNGFFVLCDGMGGHENGELASATVCVALGKYLESRQTEGEIITPDIFMQALEHAYNELDEIDSGNHMKMGTTMTCICLHKKGYFAAHIGDSRIYHIRPDSGIIFQSSDHSLVNDLLRAGELTEEEARQYPYKNIITRVMQPNQGRRSMPDIYTSSNIKSGDYFFLCSDGVLEHLTCELLYGILASNVSDEMKLEALRSICYGKTQDNYTCYLIKVDNVLPEDDDIDQ